MDRSPQIHGPFTGSRLVLRADEGERPAGQKADGQHEEAAGGVDAALEDGERHDRYPG